MNVATLVRKNCSCVSLLLILLLHHLAITLSYTCTLAIRAYSPCGLHYSILTRPRDPHPPSLILMHAGPSRIEWPGDEATRHPPGA